MNRKRSPYLFCSYVPIINSSMCWRPEWLPPIIVCAGGGSECRRSLVPVVGLIMITITLRLLHN